MTTETNDDEYQPNEGSIVYAAFNRVYKLTQHNNNNNNNILPSVLKNNNSNNIVIFLALFTDRPGALTRTSDVCSTK